MSWRRNRLVRQIRVRPRLYIALSVAILVAVLLPLTVASHPVTRFLVAWNVGTGLYVVLAAVMMIRSTHQHMRHRAQLQDDGQLVILLLVVVASVASLPQSPGNSPSSKKCTG